MDDESIFVVLFTGFFFLFFIVILLAVYLINSIILKKIFEKDGRNGWLGFVPFYNKYILTEMSGLNWYWFLGSIATVVIGLVAGVITIIPFIGPLIGGLLNMAGGIIVLVSNINIYYCLNKKFKNEDWFTIILVIFSLIGLGMLGFMKKYVYYREVEVQPDGLFGDFGFIKKDEKRTSYNNPSTNENVEVIKNESVKVSEEDVKEDKEEVNDAVVEEKPAKEEKTAKEDKSEKKEYKEHKEHHEHNHNKENKNDKKEPKKDKKDE